MTKPELHAIVKQATEDVWYRSRSMNPVEDQTEAITNKIFALLSTHVDDTSIQHLDIEQTNISAEQLLEKHATIHMNRWSHSYFKHSHCQLHTSIMGAINEALCMSPDAAAKQNKSTTNAK